MKKTGLIILGAIAIYLLMGTKKAFAAITSDNIKRGCDAWGCGAMGSDRAGHTHQGLDIKATDGQSILSPISGTVTRFPFPYSNDLSYTGIEIKNADYQVKIFYVKPVVVINSEVSQGQIIAKAQNIAAKYSSSMTNHVHIEVRNKQGILIDPATLF